MKIWNCHLPYLHLYNNFLAALTPLRSRYSRRTEVGLQTVSLMKKFKGKFVIKHKFEELYLGKDKEFMLTSSTSNFMLRFDTQRKALKYYRTANNKHRYIKELFDITTLDL